MTGPLAPGQEGSGTDRADLHQRVDKALAEFLAGQVAQLETVSEDLVPVGDVLTELVLDAGKRLRPAFCFWGWRGAGGDDGEAAVKAAACLELLHGAALVHDDVMDGSATRRGRPSVHRRFAALHRACGWAGSPERFGQAGAVLLGDLCLVWADRMLDVCGLPADALARGRPVYDLMRTELVAGQYLDVREQAVAGRSQQRALQVARFKSATYTVLRPLHLGAALAGGGPGLVDAYTRFGVPLGEAFQLRDDVLGVFGDPAHTGKPAADDLREGKRTVLIAAALERADPRQEAVVRTHLGDPELDADGADALREVIRETGALAAVERLIAARTAVALDVLADAPVAGPARAALHDLAVAATTRSR